MLFSRLKYRREDLELFEVEHGIQLPSVYRRLLIEVGVCGLSRLSPLDEWCQPHSEDDLPKDFLQRDFPSADLGNDLRNFDSSLYLRSEYFWQELICGAMRIGNMGCDAYMLMVVSGPQRGKVWYDRRASDGKGIRPLLDRGGKPVAIEEYLGPWWSLWRFTGDQP